MTTLLAALLDRLGNALTRRADRIYRLACERRGHLWWGYDGYQGWPDHPVHIEHCMRDRCDAVSITPGHREARQ